MTDFGTRRERANAEASNAEPVRADATAERPKPCTRCSGKGDSAFPVHFSMTFQPIVALARGELFAHEALVRGQAGEPAGHVLQAVTEANLHTFDQRARVAAIRTAARICLEGSISINFEPNAVHDPAHCLRTTLWAADRAGIAPERLIFEITEHARIADPARLRSIIEEYRRNGIRTAIDDFGAGYSGLHLLAEFRPDIIKLDMSLIRAIDTDIVRSSIVQGIAGTASKLGVTVIAEGVETPQERDALLDLGLRLQQGYLFARPKFEGWKPEHELSGLVAAA